MFKARRTTRFRRWLGRTLWVAGLMLLALLAVRWAGTEDPPAPVAVPPAPAEASRPSDTPQPSPSAPQIQIASDCADPKFARAAASNAASLATLPVEVFGRSEIGWLIYAPLIAVEIQSLCAPQSSGFAAALSTWQAGRGKSADGVISQAVLLDMKAAWQGRRPVASGRNRGVCPEPPAESSLETARPEEGYSGKSVQLRPGALAAYRAMAAAARQEAPQIAEDRRNLTIFSAFRSPDYDAARCARDQNCDGVVRATCSPHRTGLALDLYVGQAPGFGPDSTADPNRLAQTRGATYRWLVRNAGRFGFVNYPFEPWHWEWTGEPP
jgi:D-alanyl-D-alanine carboxypeptidase